MEEAAVNRLATSITRLTLCQVTTDEIDAATKLLDKACQKLRGIPDVPSQRITDLETTIRQLRQLSCNWTAVQFSASYEVSQAKGLAAYATYSPRCKHIIGGTERTDIIANR